MPRNIITLILKSFFEVICNIAAPAKTVSRGQVPKSNHHYLARDDSNDLLAFTCSLLCPLLRIHQIQFPQWRLHIVIFGSSDCSVDILVVANNWQRIRQA